MRVVGGGQTGADQAGWRAARRCGLETGGWMPRGWLTESGARPEFALKFGAVEMATDRYPERTEANVRDSDATLWFGSTDSPGAKTTLNACRGMGRPTLVVRPGMRPSEVATWLRRLPRLEILNVAGNRESKAPGIGDRVEAFLVAVFERLRRPR